MKVLSINDFQTVETQAEQEAIYQGKMVEQGENSAFIIHEMANMMAVVQGRLDHMRRTEGLLNSEPATKLNASVTKMSEFLMFLKKLNSRNVELSQVDLGYEVKKFIEFFGKEFTRNDIILLEEIGDNLPKVNGESSMIFMILQTVANNSMRAMQDQRSGKVITFTTRLSGGFVDVIVKDNGGGMSDERAMEIASATNYSGNQGTGQGIQMIKQWSNYMGIECKLRNISGVGVHWLFRFKVTGSTEVAA